MDKILSFKDLIFKPHPISARPDIGKGVQAVITFPNGYGLSVIRYQTLYKGLNNESFWKYGSYTSNEEEWEVAILFNEYRVKQSPLNEPFDNEIIGHLNDEQVSEMMKLLQEIKTE